MRPENMAPQIQPSGYAHEDAWDVDWLRVDSIHELHYEQYGKKDGKPGTYGVPTSRFCAQTS